MQNYLAEFKYQISQHTDCLSKDEKDKLINLILYIKEDNNSKLFNSRKYSSIPQSSIQKFGSLKEIYEEVSKRFSNDGNNSPLYSLVKFVFTIPLSKKICEFFNFPNQNLYALFPYFKFKFFNSGKVIFDTSFNNEKNFYILLSGTVEYYQTQYPNLLKNLIRKIVELKLEKYFEKYFEINVTSIEVFSEESEKLMYKKLLYKIKNSSLNESIKKDLLTVKVKPPKKIIYDQITQNFGMREIVSEIRKIKIKSKALAISEVFCIYVEKDIIIKYLSRKLLESLHSNYEFIGSVLPFLKKDYRFKLLMRKIDYLFPFKGDIIYKEGFQGHFFYLIYQGECTLKKNIYIDSNKEVTIYPKEMNFPSNLNLLTLKKYNIINLNKGSFAGIELLYASEDLYDSSLIVNNDHTILFQFDVNDYKDDYDILQRIKESLFQSFILYQNNLKDLESNLNENERMIITYRNVFKKLLTTPISNNLVEDIISDIHKKPLKSIISFHKKDKNYVLNLKKNNWFINKSNCTNLPTLNLNDSMIYHKINNSVSKSKQIKSNFFISAVDIPIDNHYNSNNENKEGNSKKKNKEKNKNFELYKKINRKSEYVKNSIIQGLNVNKKSLFRNSSVPSLKNSLYESLKNFEQREESYLTPSFKIPMISALNN